MLLGKIVKQYRDTHGLSTRHFAETCGLSCGYISMIENNRNPRTGKPLAPNLETLYKLSLGMGMSLDELIQMLDDDQLISLVPQYNQLDAAGVHPSALTPHEKEVLAAYRNQPDKQPAVDGLLGVGQDAQAALTAYTRAAKGDGAHARTAAVSEEEIRQATSSGRAPFEAKKGK